MNQISLILSEYFQIDDKKFLEGLKKFSNFFSKYDLIELENWDLFWRELEKMLGFKMITKREHMELIKEALRITKNDYKKYLDYSLKKGRGKI